MIGKFSDVWKLILWHMELCSLLLLSDTDWLGRNERDQLARLWTFSTSFADNLNVIFSDFSIQREKNTFCKCNKVLKNCTIRRDTVGKPCKKRTITALAALLFYQRLFFFRLFARCCCCLLLQFSPCFRQFTVVFHIWVKRITAK